MIMQREHKMLKGFKVYEIGNTIKDIPKYDRRDFYKICMNSGSNHISYGDTDVTVEGTILFFCTPEIPYTWELKSDKYNGYSCIFTKDFFTDFIDQKQEVDTIFEKRAPRILYLTPAQKSFLTALFQQMLSMQESNYDDKLQFMSNAIGLIIHEAIKVDSHATFFKETDRTEKMRIVLDVFEIMEEQSSPSFLSNSKPFKNAQYFSDTLHINVDSIDNAIKEITGKSFQFVLMNRFIKMAHFLLIVQNRSLEEVYKILGIEDDIFLRANIKNALIKNDHSME